MRELLLLPVAMLPSALFAAYVLGTCIHAKVPLDTACWQAVVWGFAAVPASALVVAAVVWLLTTLPFPIPESVVSGVIGGVGILAASLPCALLLHRATRSRRVLLFGLGATALALTAATLGLALQHPPSTAAGILVAGIGWHVCILSALIPWSVDSRRRHRFAKPGLCRACGYDLSGVPGDRCPECGEAFRCAPLASA